MTTLKQGSCLAALLFVAGVTTASAQSLGSSLTAVARAYPEAARTRVDGASALELSDVDYGGVRWSKVDFIFDATGHLSRLHMNTTAASYGTVLKLAELQLSPPQPAAAGLARAAEDAPSNLEIRVCEGDDGGVEMTFEPISTLS